MRRAKLLLLLLISVALILTLAGCRAAATGDSIRARVGTWKTAQTIQPFFYQQFLPEGDGVEIAPFTNPGDMKTALLAGSLDMCGTTLVTAITAVSKGEPIVVVAGMSNRCSALVVHKDAGINSVKDLAGKKIAYVPGTMHHLLLLETLDRHGLDWQEDVELIRVDFFDMAQALAQGTVDAFYSGEPYPSVAVAQGFGKILAYPEDDFGVINSAMITTKDKIAREPELVQKLVTAHVRATEYLLTHREAWLHKAAEFGTDPGVLMVSAGNIDLFWQIDERYMEGVRVLAQRMWEQGIITEIPDIESMFDLRFLTGAAKEIGHEKER
ncbi:MAG TPA: ABC transporter substrate-binding protein [Clostridia bacterium]|nr:ABC transporter substrate-binding protein [Clostridia bacterium]